MQAAKRSKRDTAENIYRTCKLSGTCPDDVVNKIENRTWADVLLQAFSSILYLGNLGIGTGKGTTSIRPIAGGRVIPESIAPPVPGARPNITRPSITRPTRPFSVPIDTIGVSGRPVDPLGSRPIDILNPNSPAIVPLNEVIPDTVITLGEGSIPDLEVITDTTSINGHPTVFQSPDNGIAILNVTPADPPPTRVIFQQETINPTFTVESTVGHIEPTYDIFVNPFITSDIITLGEEIPLEPINPRSEFDIEDIPKSSTPSDTLSRVYTRAREFYRRRVQQQPTRNINMLGDVSRAITFGFENPAFDPEVSLQFEQDVNEVRAAPDADFAGIRKIGRAILSSTDNRTVRVSRLGSRAGVQTRSGTVIGQDIHFYYDISPIPSVELSTLGSASTDLIEPSTAETFIDSYVVGSPDSNNTMLLDTYAESFNNAQLIFPGLDESDEISTIPIVQTSVKFPPLSFDIGSGYFYSAELPNTKNTNIVPDTPTVPLVPNISVFVNSSDYDLHPGLLKKRKRKLSDSF